MNTRCISDRWTVLCLSAASLGLIVAGCAEPDRIVSPRPAAEVLQGPVASGRQLAFASNRDGNWEIYRVNEDGTGLINLTNNPATDGFTAEGSSDFVWQPGGGLIAFTSDRSGSVEIYLMTPDGAVLGSGAITSGGGVEHDLAWSPDGTQLAFARTAPTDTLDDLWTYDRITGSVVNRTATAAIDEDQATWSPTGSLIAFRWTGAPSAWCLYCPPIVTAVARLDVASGTTVWLASGQGSPAWSPLTTGPIAFVRSADSDDEIFTVRFDGTSLTQIVELPGPDATPRWASDGVRLAFVRLANGTTPSVYQVDATGRSPGSNLIQITSNGHSPDWSNEGTRVAFVRSGILATPFMIRPISSIYTVRSGGGVAPTLLVSGPSSRNENPRWRPE